MNCQFELFRIRACVVGALTCSRPSQSNLPCAIWAWLAAHAMRPANCAGVCGIMCVHSLKLMSLTFPTFQRDRSALKLEAFLNTAARRGTQAPRSARNDAHKADLLWGAGGSAGYTRGVPKYTQKLGQN